jgi:hypothetical protein
MSRDKSLLVFFWILCIGLLFKYIPTNKIRHGLLAFVYKQAITLLFGLVVAEKGLIKYPVREFKKAYKGSFSFEYFLYPSLCAIFNFYYPESRSRLFQFLYINSHAALLTLVEVVVERYTNLIKYVK